MSAVIENPKLVHNVFIDLVGPDGELKQREELHNLIPTVGKEAIAKLLKEGTTRPSYMAIGTGNTAAAAGDTKLQTELSRKAASETGAAAKVFTIKAEWAAGEGTGAITEAGILSASSEGTLFARAVFSVVNKGAEDTLTITWTITVE